jgi:hypothetical protein
MVKTATATMPEPDEVVFTLTREDVIECAKEMGIPPEAITDDVFQQVKKGVEWGLECWSEVMKEAINFALKS